jgi:hypothetical protein
MDREQYRQCMLSGTVTFPPTMPAVAQLELRTLDHAPASGPGMLAGDRVLVATQCSSPRVTIKRSILLCDVRAVFLPRDPARIRYDDGLWLLDRDVAACLPVHLQSIQRLLGVVFVPEFSPSLLEVSAGMTACESIQYYPPMPHDRSHNHYEGAPQATAQHYQSQGEFAGQAVASPCEDSLRWSDPYYPMGPAPCEP